MAVASKYPVRQWLNFCLHKILLESGIPALNQGFLDALDVDPARKSEPGFVLPALTENSVTTGELHSRSQLTLSVVGTGSRPGAPGGDPAPTGTFYRTYRTRFIYKAPKCGLNAPEDWALLHGVFEDTLVDLFSDLARYSITPQDPDSQMPALPGGASFQGCQCGDVVPLPMPVKDSDGVTYVQGGYADHYSFFILAADRPGRIG